MQPGRPSSSLHYAVGELSGKLDGILSALEPRIKALESADTALDHRVTDLEVWRGRALGGGGVILFLVTSWELVRYVYHR